MPIRSRSIHQIQPRDPTHSHTMADNSCLATSTAPASHSFKAFSLSSGDAVNQSTHEGQTDSLTYRPSYDSYNSKNFTCSNAAVSDFSKHLNDPCENSISNTLSGLRSNSEFIHQSIDDICSKARKLIGKDTYESTNYDLGIKEKEIMSKYMTPSDTSRYGVNYDLDYLLRKYSAPSASYNPHFNADDTLCSSFKYSDGINFPVHRDKSRASFNSGSDINLQPSMSNRHNPSLSSSKLEDCTSSKMCRRSSKDHPRSSPSNMNAADHGNKKSKGRLMSNESPNNNTIRFTRCPPSNERHGPAKSLHRTSTKKRSSKNDLTNNSSCQCHKPKVPCQIHDTAQTSMSHGQFSGVTNEGGQSADCSCGGTAPEPSAVEQRDILPPEDEAEVRETVKTNKKKTSKKNKHGSRHFMINEAKRVYKENEMLKAEGMYLRNELECTRKGLIMECAKVLHSVLTFCDEKTKKNKKACHNSLKAMNSKCTCSRMV